jgi:predicted PhzF superfamily epimerase YddE/YHI9
LNVETRQYRFFIADVFAERPFSGNQLAVLPEASRLPPDLIQTLAPEFNFGETTFGPLGRPSLIEARAIRRGGCVAEGEISGRSVVVDGTINVPA